MDINRRIAKRVKELREAEGYSLDALAERSQVSRSHISLIERGQSSPTASVLDKLSAALGVTLASLFEESASDEPPSPLARSSDQPVWTDPVSGYVRRNLSPDGVSPIQLVEVVFPPGKRVAYETDARENETHQQIWVIDGAMDLLVGTQSWQLKAGDCLAMRLDCPIVFSNPGRKNARYLVALTTLGSTQRKWA
ncbi:XRE family transcriptional regulator [Paraburkholderia sp.]|uniref:helix-turn-helix domain-containing protein n=1 Tax=Paraburkholderia sp. TaxID=1926495 RepID=UPI00238508B2|nr:XRE family transcriptional regulator [Paraburkholderia sp.]MDE1180548.1 XRE family transcriptional regulator [Paraburkholderia sp.]